MDEPTKDVIIAQQELIIRDSTTTINQLRSEVAELRHFKHKYASVTDEPIRFLLWVWLKDVWPFKFLWL
jgi:hypothetical protein